MDKLATTKKGKFLFHKGSYIIYLNENEYLGDS